MKSNLNSISFSTLDRVLVFASLLLLLMAWAYVITNYNKLPETIAVHFSGTGEPDGYDSKNSIWLAPIFFTLLTLAMLYGAKNPKQIDISNKITNAKQAQKSSKTLIFSALLLPYILMMIVYSMVNASVPNPKNYKWVFPALITAIVVFLIIIFSINLNFKKK